MTVPRVSIVLPTYCEVSNLGRIVPAIADSVSKSEINVVDDNSPDGTADLARELSSGHPLRLIEHFQLRWAGKSKLRMGVQWAYLQQLLRLIATRYRLIQNRPLIFREPISRPGQNRQRAAPDNRRPAGFTLAELLVSAAIVGLLSVLLLPAVNVARESARRSQCSNHLRQISLAVHHFHSARGHYPLSRFKVRKTSDPADAPHDVGPSSTSWSWLAKILPFVEAEPLYVAAGIPNSKLEDSDVRSRVVSLYLCPSDGLTGAPSRKGSGHFEELFMGVTNYKANMGQNWDADETQGAFSVGSAFRHRGRNGSYDGQSHGDGVMWRDDRKYRMSDKKIRAGLSKTFLLGEDVPRFNTWNAWAYANNVFGTCAIPLNYNGGHPSWWPDSMGFRSQHPGGGNFAYCDGRVSFVTNSTSLVIYRQHATRYPP